MDLIYIVSRDNSKGGGDYLGSIPVGGPEHLESLNILITLIMIYLDLSFYMQ